jgi:hypothetical protein
MPGSEISEIFGKNLRERAYKALQQVSDSRRAVEDEFRDLLGISEEESSPEAQARTDNDLMWIPEPETIDPIRPGKRGN